MEPRHIVIERGSLKRLYVYSNRDMDRERRQKSEREKKASMQTHTHIIHTPINIQTFTSINQLLKKD